MKYQKTGRYTAAHATYSLHMSGTPDTDLVRLASIDFANAATFLEPYAGNIDLPGQQAPREFFPPGDAFIVPDDSTDRFAISPGQYWVTVDFVGEVDTPGTGDCRFGIGFRNITAGTTPASFNTTRAYTQSQTVAIQFSFAFTPTVATQFAIAASSQLAAQLSVNCKRCQVTVERFSEGT